MEKVIRNGRVAVLVSLGLSGWYSCNDSHKELLFHPKLVAMVEANRQSEITQEWLEKELGIKDVYCGGVKDLQILWFEIGTRFELYDENGYEALWTVDKLTLIA